MMSLISIIEKGLQEYADNVEAKLREIKVDLKHEDIIYVGGGASVIKMFGRTKGRNIQYVTDEKANAIGYRYKVAPRLTKLYFILLLNLHKI